LAAGIYSAEAPDNIRHIAPRSIPPLLISNLEFRISNHQKLAIENPSPECDYEQLRLIVKTPAASGSLHTGYHLLLKDDL